MRKEKDKSKLWAWIKEYGDLIILLLAILGIYLSINGRIDITNEKISELNREIGEIRTELDCCEKYYLNP